MVEDYRGAHWRGTLRAPWLNADHVSAMPALRLPALVAVGELDVPPVHAMAETYARLLPGARREVLDGVGHMSPMEDAARVTALLDAFFRDASG
jgi:pimeloyl-ACP methyl ester carboxylesterase